METSKQTLRSLGVGRLIGIGAIFAIVLGAIVAVPAFASAADTGTAATGRTAVFAQLEEDGEGPFPGQHGFRGHRVAGGAVVTTAELAGTEPADVAAALQEGGSLVSYASGFGISEAELIDAISANADEKLAERVANGDMTQEEADEKLAGLEERLPELVNTEGLGPKHDCGDKDNPTEESTSDTV